MKFKCPVCDKIISRDIGDIANKNNLVPIGYKTTCVSCGDKEVIATPLYSKKEEWERIIQDWFIELMQRIESGEYVQCNGCGKKILKEDATYDYYAWWCWDCDFEWQNMRLKNSKMTDITQGFIDGSFKEEKE